jgi:hypothetical protein
MYLQQEMVQSVSARLLLRHISFPVLLMESGPFSKLCHLINEDVIQYNVLTAKGGELEKVMYEPNVSKCGSLNLSQP